MRTLPAFSFLWRPKGHFPVFFRLLSVLTMFCALSLLGSAAQAAGPSASNGRQFSTQARIGFHSGDDWEPSIAADRYGHLYALYKHYDVKGGGTCPDCNLHLLFQRSDDEGKTWSAPRAIAPIYVQGGQYDSQIVVDQADGRTVWASFLQNSKSLIVVVKSSDFGVTWSAPMIVTSRPPGLDKDELAVRGKRILVAYDDNFNTWASISLDGGVSWTTHEVFPTSDRFSISLSAGAAIDSHGNFFVSWDSFDKAHRKHGHGSAALWVSRSSDTGKSWTRTVIDVSAAAPRCQNCGYDYFSSQMTLRIGSDDMIYVLWNGTVGEKGFTPERIYFSRSTDDGKTYSAREDVSDAPPGVEHCFPALAVGLASGDVRIGWMDMRTGEWNVFYRISLDGGKHFGPTIRISSYVPGYPYLSKAGFKMPYGDYFSMTNDEDNNTQMTFGEGPSYQGPGNIWVSHQLGD